MTDKFPEDAIYDVAIRSICTNSSCEFHGILHIHTHGDIDSKAIILRGLFNWIRNHPFITRSE